MEYFMLALVMALVVLLFYVVNITYWQGHNNSKFMDEILQELEKEKSVSSALEDKNE